MGRAPPSARSGGGGTGQEPDFPQGIIFLVCTLCKRGDLDRIHEIEVCELPSLKEWEKSKQDINNTRKSINRHLDVDRHVDVDRHIVIGTHTRTSIYVHS